MPNKTIKQTMLFSARPETIYLILMDSKLHSKLIGDKARIDNRVGGRFSTFSGYSKGVTKKLVLGRKIVQSWISSDLPKGLETEITFDLKRKGTKTQLVFTQTNVPAENYHDLAEGWKEFYWNPLKEMLRA